MLICYGNIFKSKKHSLKQIWVLVYISLFFFVFAGQSKRGALLRIPLPKRLSLHQLRSQPWDESRPPLITQPSSPHPENARILFLAPTAIVGCGHITICCAWFQHRDCAAADTCRTGRIVDVGTSAASLNTEVGSSCTALPSSIMREMRPPFFGRAEVSRGNVVLIWFVHEEMNSPI